MLILYILLVLDVFTSGSLLVNPFKTFVANPQHIKSRIPLNLTQSRTEKQLRIFLCKFSHEGVRRLFIINIFLFLAIYLLKFRQLYMQDSNVSCHFLVPLYLISQIVLELRINTKLTHTLWLGSLFFCLCFSVIFVPNWKKSAEVKEHKSILVCPI